MFGDFWQQFGLQFPFFGIDQQGGMFAAFQAPDPNTQQQPGMENKSPSPPGPQAAAAPQPKPSPGASPLASPLAPQASAAAPQQQPQSPLERRGSFGLDQRMM